MFLLQQPTLLQKPKIAETNKGRPTGTEREKRLKHKTPRTKKSVRCWSFLPEVARVRVGRVEHSGAGNYIHNRHRRDTYPGAWHARSLCTFVEQTTVGFEKKWTYFSNIIALNPPFFYL